jgi:hypothetical protein
MTVTSGTRKSDLHKQNVSVPMLFQLNRSVPKIVYIIQSRRSFCASPSCRSRLRLGFQSLGLTQKDLLLLLMTIPPPPGGTAILPEYIHYYG